MAGFALGVAASLLAAVLFDLVQVARSQSRVKLTGYWFEHIPRSTGRTRSVGRIAFDRVRRRFTFDGTNFTDGGEPFCHWETVASHLDRQQRKLYYTFRTHVVGEEDATYYGFGVVDLHVVDGRLTPRGGHYVSASVDGGVPMSHSMEHVECIRSRFAWRSAPGSIPEVARRILVQHPA